MKRSNIWKRSADETNASTRSFRRWPKTIRARLVGKSTRAVMMESSESAVLAASYVLINKFNNASFKSSSRNQEDVYTSKSPNMRLNDSKKIIVNRKMISTSTLKSKGSHGDVKYYSIEANLKV